MYSTGTSTLGLHNQDVGIRSFLARNVETRLQSLSLIGTERSNLVYNEDNNCHNPTQHQPNLT